MIDGVPVLGGADELGSMTDVSVMVCTRLPDNYVSCPRMVEALGLSPEHEATLIHPSASVSTTSRVGPGTVLLAHAVLTAAVTVGSHVAIMPHVILTHDDVVGDFATLASGYASALTSTSGRAPISARAHWCARIAALAPAHWWAWVPS